MMTRPGDHEVRQQALDISRSYIVKAPAGSGKTTLLVKRYLKLLTVVDHPEEVIAITFTRKAAGELIARVMSALNGADEVDDPGESELFEIARRLKERDRAQGWNLALNRSRLRIMTIDALCHSIVRQMPWSAGFGASPSNVNDDVSQLYLQAASQALIKALSSDELSESAGNVLAAINNDFSRTCDLISAMLAKRDQWHGLITGHTDAGARQYLEDNWVCVAEHLMENCLMVFDPSDRQELIELGQYAAMNLTGLNRNSPICALENITEFPRATIDHIDRWRAITELLLKGSNGNPNFRSSSPQGITKAIGFPAIKDGGDIEKKKRFQNLLSRINNSELETNLAMVKMLPDTAYTDSEWHLLDSLLSLLKMAQIELLDLFQQQGCCDHIEIASRAVVALGDQQGDGPSDLALRLDHVIKHLLVDEFQDTSQSQMLLLKHLTAGWQVDDGRTLFFVGDPMQSIYRFRQADVGLFLSVFSAGFENIEIGALTLTTNFRSSRSIVDWVNRTFVRIFPKRDDMQFGAVGYVNSIAYENGTQNTAAETIHVVDPAQEAVEICRLIERLDSQSPDTSKAILVRGRTHLADIVTALRDAGILYQGVRIEQLKNQSCIQDMMALTSALLHFGDKLAWLAVLRAPWCGLCLADLTLIAEQAKVSTVWQICQFPPDALSASGRRRVARLVDTLEPVLKRTGRLPLNQLVARAWHALSGPEIINSNELINIRTYIDLLGEIQQAGTLDTGRRLEAAMKELWAVSGSSGGQVQLMTMHMAKGLEFDVVILPGLARRSRADDSRLLIWKEFVVGNQPSKLLVSPIKRNDEEARYKFVQSLERQSEREEVKRLLYVAATRARQQLHLFMAPQKEQSSSPSNAGGSTLQSLLEPVVNVEGQLEKVTGQAADDDREAVNPDLSYYRLPLDHTPAARKNNIGLDIRASGHDLVEYEWVGVSARHQGTLVHEAIYQLATGSFSQDNDTDSRWYNQLCALGMQPGQIQTSIDKIRIAIGHMTTDERARWILADSHRQVKNEWSMSAIVDGSLENIIIDRTFKDEYGVRWIIDYKTSTHEGADLEAFIDSELVRYRPQLERYAAIMRLSESDPIKLGLYFPLLKAWREWDYVG